jgi:dephospho-CoA kinase
VIKVYVVAGPAGSGKSRFAKLFSENLGIPWLDFDDDINQLLSSNKETISNIGMENFLSQFRELRYQTIINRALKEFNSSNKIVLSAPFTLEISSKERWDSRFSPLLAAGAVLNLFWIDTPEQVRRKRISDRGELRDAEKLEKLRPEASNPKIDHVLIDGQGDFAKIIEKL